MKTFTQLVLIALILVLPFSRSAGADKTGTVQGVVEGPRNALLPDAEVSLTNKEGAQPLVTRSGKEGEFIFENVPTGEYVLTAKLVGFQDVQLPVTVGPTPVPHLRVKMKVAVVPSSRSASADQAGTVQGVIEGPRNALLPDAEVSLTNKEGDPPLVTRSDEVGEFIFENVPPGEHVLLAKLVGFQDVQLTVTVGPTPVPHLRVQMKVAEVTDKVTVSADAQPLLAGENKDAFNITSHLLMNMPSKSGDYLTIPSLFLDNSMVGAEGVKVLVDGVEVGNEDIPLSSVKDVAVNRNPFSAEFGRPGKGRLEITTKKGVHGRYRGSVLAMYRNSNLYTTEAFATTKPFQERKLLEGEVDGPVPFLQTATFFISGRYRNFDDQSVVNAVTPAGPVINNFSIPTEAAGLLGRFDMRINQVHKATLFF